MHGHQPGGSSVSTSTTNGRNGTNLSTGVAPPHDLEAEQSVLGGILLSDRAMNGLVLEEDLKPEDFYRPRHGTIFAAMVELHREGEPVDVLTVSDQLRRDGTLEQAGGKAAIDELTGGVPGLGGIRRYARIVTDLARTRELLHTTYEIQAAISERRHDGAELLADAEGRIFRLGQTARRTRDVALRDALTAEITRLKELANSDGSVTGMRTGLSGLDEMINGLGRGRLYIVAARPGMGKTTVGQNIAVHAALRENASVLFASLEMGESELVQRHLASESGVPGDRIQRGQLRDSDWRRLLKTAVDGDQARFFILDEADLTVFDLRAHARQVAVREDGLDLVVVDYLQLMRADPPSGNRTEDVSTFSRGLKRLAREMNCPVIALAQLSRSVEQRTDKRPLLSDLRESGQIEADADVVVMMYRDDYYHSDSDHPGETELLIRKNRHGAAGADAVVRLHFDTTCQRFRTQARAATADEPF
jgi:replicative DNA helicase